MSELDPVVVDAPVEAPAPEPVAEPEPAPVAVVAQDDEPITDDATLNQQITDQAIAVPDGEKLVPASLLRNVAISYRNKLKEAKQGSPEAVALKQQLDAAEARLREAEPLAHAFRAIQQAQPPQAPQPATMPAPAEDTAELAEIAKDFDFYTPDGKPDLDRARRVQARESRRAQQIAQAQTAPLVQHTLSGQAHQNIARAKATVHPITKQAADPQIIDRLVAGLAQQPDGLVTLANPETMKQIWLNAYALTTFQAQAPAAAAAPATPVTPPVVVERSGGRDAAQVKALSPAEKRAAKDAGLTEKAYLEMAQGMKWILLAGACLLGLS